MNPDSIKDLTQSVINFRDARDWAQFHDPKNAAISLILEASEVLEHFQWKTEAEVGEYLKTNKPKIAEELADVLYYILLMSHDMSIDISQALETKIAKNAKKYPVEKAKGNHTKYTELN